jgi:hypothetical protein
MKRLLVCLMMIQVLSPKDAQAINKIGCSFTTVPAGCVVLNTISNGQATTTTDASNPVNPTCMYPSSLPPTDCARVLLCKKPGMDDCMIQYGILSRTPASIISSGKCGINGKPARLLVDGNGYSDQCVK